MLTTIIAIIIIIGLVILTVVLLAISLQMKTLRLTEELQRQKGELKRLQELTYRTTNRTHAHYDYLKVANQRILAIYHAVHNAGIDDIARGVLDKQFEGETPLFGKVKQPTNQTAEKAEEGESDFTMGRDFWEKFIKHCDETGRTVNLEDIKAEEDNQPIK